MTERTRWIAAGIAAGIACLGAWAAEPVDPLADARAAWERRASPESAAEAWERYRAAARAAPDDYEAHWGAARAAWFLGEVATADDRKGRSIDREALYAEAMVLAERAVALAPDRAEGHLWNAVVTGVYGEARGILKSLGLAPRVREQAEAALAIDPAVEGHAPGRVLGRLYFRLPWFKGGDDRRAIEHLERSAAGTPGHPLTRLYLAEVYRAAGRRADAVAQLRLVVDAEPDPRWAAEHARVALDARALLRKLE